MADEPDRGARRPCPYCRGAGTIEVTGIYRETLDLLAARPGEVCGADLARLAGCSATAMNNRLAALESFGLAASRRWGRKVLYRAAGRGGPPDA